MKDVAQGLEIDFGLLSVDEEVTIDFILNNVVEEANSLSENDSIRNHQLVGTIAALSLLVFLQEIKNQELQKNGG